ncbi:MAG: amidohydrolase family protein [Bacillota bacterium]
MNVLIKNANFHDGKGLQDIYLENNIIKKIGPDLEINSAEVIDAEGNLVINGVINAHAHIDKSLIIDRKPYVDEAPPVRAGWVRDLKGGFTKEDIKERARKVVELSSSNGVIGIRTNVDVDPLVGLKGIEAVLELKQEVSDFMDIHVVAFCQEGFNRFPETKELLEEALRMGADSVGGHTSMDADRKREHIDTIFALAKTFDVDMDFHADETGRPDDHMLPYLIEKTIGEGFQGRVNAIHCCSLPVISEEEVKKDIKGIKEADINVIVCPTAIATRKLTEVKKLLEAGINVSLGTDNIQDLFNPLGNGNLFEAAYLLTYVHRFYANSDLEKIFRMLTQTPLNLVNVERFAIKEGNKPNLTILGCKNPEDIFRTSKLIQRRVL